MKKFTISKTFTFEAAHQLPNHDGLCKNLHGHSYVGVIEVTLGELIDYGAKEGMVMDYGDLKSLIEPLREQYLDHHYLNETLPVVPTAENIAKWIWDQLSPKLGGKLSCIIIRETANSEARYQG